MTWQVHLRRLPPHRRGVGVSRRGAVVERWRRGGPQWGAATSRGGLRRAGHGVHRRSVTPAPSSPPGVVVRRLRVPASRCDPDRRPQPCLGSARRAPRSCSAWRPSSPACRCAWPGVGGGLDVLGDDDFLGERSRGPIGVVDRGDRGRPAGVGRPDPPLAMAGRRLPRCGVAAAALAGFAIEGHTRSQDPLAVMVGFDLVHLAAAALWLGGIAGLVVAFRTGPRPGPARASSSGASPRAAAVIARAAGVQRRGGDGLVRDPAVARGISTSTGLGTGPDHEGGARACGGGARCLQPRQWLVPDVRATAWHSSTGAPAGAVSPASSGSSWSCCSPSSASRPCWWDRSPNAVPRRPPAPATTLPGSVELALSGETAGTVQVAVAPARCPGPTRSASSSSTPTVGRRSRWRPRWSSCQRRRSGIGPAAPSGARARRRLVPRDRRHRPGCRHVGPSTIRVRVGEFDASTATTDGRDHALSGRLQPTS